MKFDSDYELFLIRLTESEIHYTQWMIFLKIMKMKDQGEALFKRLSDKTEIVPSSMLQMVALGE